MAWTEVATFPSKSDPTRVYIVKRNAGGVLGCNCPAWRFKREGDRGCTHTKEVVRRELTSARVIVDPPPPRRVNAIPRRQEQQAAPSNIRARRIRLPEDI